MNIGDEPLTALLRSLGGWPVLEKNWKPPNDTIEHLLGKFKVELNEHFLMSLSVVRDDKNSSIHVLQASIL